MKVLIWDDFPLLNIGGPPGYLFNIHEYLKQHPCQEIVFLSDILKGKRENTNYSSLSNIDNQKPDACGLKRIISFFVPKLLLRTCCRVRDFFKIPLLEAIDFHIGQFRIIKRPLSLEELNQFDYVHFHILTQFTSFCTSYKDYKCKTILTSHCPCSFVDEMMENKSCFVKLFRQIGLWNESRAYYSANYIMFPCREAREPYEKNYQLKRAFSRNERKFFYVTSSITDKSIDLLKFKPLSQLGIPPQSFVICFFGRHISIKGYDILKEVGMALLNDHPNLYIICAGKGDIVPPKHDRWIELGFVDNVNEWMSQCDLYILPNKDTYFDLVLLEILRASLPVVISNKGGNNYFKKLPEFGISAIDYFDLKNPSTIITIVERYIELKQNNPEEFKRLKENNRLIFLNYFTQDKYIENYIKSLSELE